MMFRFLHAADVHLGYEQYGNKERYNDFGRAFEHLVHDALDQRVNAVLLAGDLFHKHALEPQTLLQATKILRPLKDAGIPVIAIEGNHERPHLLENPPSPDSETSHLVRSRSTQGRTRFTWLDYLAELGLLVVLDPAYENGEVLLDPWDGSTGAYIDLPCGARVMGMRFYGGMTPRVVAGLGTALGRLPGPRPLYTILMLHAGLEGILDNYSATLTRAQLEPLRAHADYLALGHIHKPFVQDDWIYNPGSLETNSTAEVEWEDRGYFLVEVDPSRTPAHAVTRILGKRRAFERLSFSVGEHESPQALYRALEAYLRREATPERVARHPVVELHLTGKLPFEHVDLDAKHIQDLVEETFAPICFLLKDTTSSLEFDIHLDDTMTRADLERHVIRELVERDVRHRGQSERWANMVLNLKRLALSDSRPEEIVNQLRSFRDLAEEGET
jgi:DNA repair exonuclease SbcCD nuclease subunit